MENSIGLKISTPGVHPVVPVLNKVPTNMSYSLKKLPSHPRALQGAATLDSAKQHCPGIGLAQAASPSKYHLLSTAKWPHEEVLPTFPA